MKAGEICDGCGKPVKRWIQNKRFCSRKCYHPTDIESVGKRFWKNVHIGKISECWLWTSPSVIKGYPSFCYKRKSRRGSHIVWLLTHGKLPTQWVLHSCDTPLCCNPEHLFLGNALTNMQDKTRKGRNNPAVGERAASAKLTKRQVISIRRLYARGDTQRSIAARFGVGFKAISKIVLNQRWKHV